ncbi:hypothetical protein V1517DRAFT_185497 [Lipomyces orientalis]|uniref:Uncharacterized protein n=1 Tax=Lipomyces orientalis TaxID=1233043 RepID=A0ACC3TIN7_9ASCO
MRTIVAPYRFVRLFSFFAGSFYSHDCADRASDQEQHMLDPLLRRGNLSDEELNSNDISSLDGFDGFDSLYELAINAGYDSVHSDNSQLSAPPLTDALLADDLFAITPASRSATPLSFENRARSATVTYPVVRAPGKVKLYTPERYRQYLWHYYTPIRQRCRSSLFDNCTRIVPYYQWSRLQELKCPKRCKCEARIMRRSPIDRVILQPIAEIVEFHTVSKSSEAKGTGDYVAAGTPGSASRTHRKRRNVLGKWCNGMPQ